MRAVECDREPDVIAAVLSGRWPDRCEADLGAHVSGCAICRDVAAVAVAFGAEQDAAWQSVRVPSAAHMWWRLQMRARQDAARAAVRPIAVVQGMIGSAIAAAAVAVIAIGLAGGAWLPAAADQSPAVSMVGSVSTVIRALLAAAAVTPQTTLVLGGIAAGLILMPVAVYFALSE